MVKSARSCCNKKIRVLPFMLNPAFSETEHDIGELYDVTGLFTLIWFDMCYFIPFWGRLLSVVQILLAANSKSEAENS